MKLTDAQKIKRIKAKISYRKHCKHFDTEIKDDTEICESCGRVFGNCKHLWIWHSPKGDICVDCLKGLK